MSLFSLPFVTTALPEAKLYFYATGTSNPQPTYTTPSLGVEHSNPVVANSAGRFPEIFLDPELPDYRVTFTDKDDVTQPGYPADNVPSSQKGSTTYRLKHTLPELIIEETDAPANEDKWVVKASGGVLTIAARNSAESADTAILTVERTGTTIDSITLGAAITAGGVPLAGTGSFTGTLTGCTTSPTASILWRRSGSLVYLKCGAGLAATSNTTAMTITGMPADIRPTTDVVGTFLTRLVDNGTYAVGTVQVTDAGVLVFNTGVVGTGVFTNSGTKGIPGVWTLVYAVA